jgi:hypothetical protein
MKRIRQYTLESWLIVTAMLVSVMGFWSIYFESDADPQPHHHLHLVTTFIWMGLLLTQLRLIANGSRANHRKLGLAVLFFAPLLVATTAMLSVRSAHAGIVSGEGDFLIIQNVGVTLELAVFIFLAFLFKERRQLHGALLISTSILFMGIALFFALISFVPQYRIEGPETFYRFQTAAMTGQIICLVIGFLFVFRDWRNGWPYLLAGVCFLLNGAILSLLTRADLIDPLTRLVGSMSQPITFVASFALILSLLMVTVKPRFGPPPAAAGYSS